MFEVIKPIRTLPEHRHVLGDYHKGITPSGVVKLHELAQSMGTVEIMRWLEDNGNLYGYSSSGVVSIMELVNLIVSSAKSPDTANVAALVMANPYYGIEREEDVDMQAIERIENSISRH